MGREAAGAGPAGTVAAHDREDQGPALGIDETARTDEPVAAIVPVERFLVIRDEPDVLLVEPPQPVVNLDVLPVSLRGNDEDIAGLSIRVLPEREEDRELPFVSQEVILGIIGQVEGALQGPVEGVVGFIGPGRTAFSLDAGTDDHEPFAGLFVPPGERIAEFTRNSLPFLLLDGRMGLGDPFRQVGILRIFRECKGDTLVALFVPVAEGIDEHGTAICIEGGAAGPDTVRSDVVVFRENSFRNVLPVDQVVTDPVSPVDVVPVRTGRVVLISEVVLPVIIERGMRLIHPVARRIGVHLRPVRIVAVFLAVNLDVLVGQGGNLAAGPSQV